MMKTDSIEESAFGSVKSSMEHDVQAMIVYTKKFGSYENAMYWAKRTWQKQQRDNCLASAKVPHPSKFLASPKLE